jgi:hypothetical protein
MEWYIKLLNRSRTFARARFTANLLRGYTVEAIGLLCARDAPGALDEAAAHESRGALIVMKRHHPIEPCGIRFPITASASGEAAPSLTRPTGT